MISRLQVNVISTYMLCALVLPLLSKTAHLPHPIKEATLRPHLVVVTSAREFHYRISFLLSDLDPNTVHGLAKFPERKAREIFQALNNPNQYLEDDRYNVTKMLDLLLTRQLAKSPAVDPDVIVCSVNPNFCKSELMRDAPKIVQMWVIHSQLDEIEDG